MAKLWIIVLIVFIVCITAFLITALILIYLGITNHANRNSKNKQSANMETYMGLLYATIFSKQPLQIEVNVGAQEEKEQPPITTSDVSKTPPNNG